MRCKLVIFFDIIDLLKVALSLLGSCFPLLAATLDIQGVLNLFFQ